MRIIIGVVIAFACKNAIACYFPPETKYAAPKFIDYKYFSVRWDGIDFDYAPNVVMQEFSAPRKKEPDQVPVDQNCVNWGGGVCESNVCENAKTFVKAMADSGVDATDQLKMADIRSSLLKKCGTTIKKDEVLAEIAQIKNEKSKAYAQYLAGLVHFYAFDYETAYQIFDSLTEMTPKSDWAVETAKYLKGRTKLVASQEKWDGYSEPEKSVDKALLKKAESDFKDYVAAYPRGRYVQSATDLQRKFYYLSGERQKLNAIVLARANQALASSNEPEQYEKAFNEFRSFFAGKVHADVDHPVLIAREWLKRAEDWDNQNLENLSSDEVARLDKNPLKSKYPSLFLFLKALGLYKTGQKEQLLKLTDAYAKGSLSAVSVQMFRAAAMMRLGQNEQALQTFMKLKKDMPKEEVLDLHILEALLKLGKKEQLFDKTSILQNDKLSRDLLLYIYSDAELRELLRRENLAPKNRNYVVQELLRRNLFRRDFQIMAALYSSKGVDFGILNGVKEPVLVLVTKPFDQQALVKVGRFIYDNLVTPTSALGEYPELDVDELSPYASRYEGFSSNTKFPAIAYFKDVADTFATAKGKNNLEAESLHYLIQCFGGARNMHKSLTCQGGIGVKNDSKLWFKKLHKKYANSSWAKKNKYYY